MDRYVKFWKVGQGSYGTVYLAVDRITDRVVALKKTHQKIVDRWGIHKSTQREIHFLRLLNESRFIVQLIDIVPIYEPNSKPDVILIYEYLDTDLKKHMDYISKGPYNNDLLSPTRIQNFLFQLCIGVAHCHSCGILHRDLKPQNLLIDKKKGILKIADFGLARHYRYTSETLTPEVGTLPYRAPELLMGATKYCTGVDMWSIGCIFAEMVTMKVLFDGNTESGILIEIFRLLGTPNEVIWPGVTKLNRYRVYPDWEPKDLAQAIKGLGLAGLDLLKKMLMLNPDQRISAADATVHPYFDSLDKFQFLLNS